MDIDETIQELLDNFVKEVQTSKDIQSKIQTIKWQILCIFASTQNIYDAPTSMEDVITK